jgi:hypothetical protein
VCSGDRPEGGDHACKNHWIKEQPKETDVFSSIARQDFAQKKSAYHPKLNAQGF